MLNTFNFPHLLLLLPPLRVCFPFEFLMESISSQQNMLEGRRKALRKVEELSFFGMILAASELFPRWTAVLACCEFSNRSCKCHGIVTTFTVPWPKCARSFGVYPSILTKSSWQRHQINFWKAAEKSRHAVTQQSRVTSRTAAKWAARSLSVSALALSEPQSASTRVDLCRLHSVSWMK